jgi:hypothetical protein
MMMGLDKIVVAAFVVVVVSTQAHSCCRPISSFEVLCVCRFYVLGVWRENCVLRFSV